MSTTATRCHNRVARYQTIDSAPLILSATPVERQAVMADTVFAAILTLKSLLASEDPALVLKAAELILDVEKTRMRHDRDVIGMSMTAPSEPTPNEPVSSHEDSSQPANESSVNWADPFEVFVSQVQAKLQAEMDQDGHGYQVSREYARELAEDQIRCERIRRMNAATSVSTSPSPMPVSVNLNRSS